MPIQQTKKQDDLEKRLKLLRSQVYGKSALGLNASIKNTSVSPASLNDISYLYKDLIKIIIFSAIALTIQLSLFILVQKNLIVLSF